MERGNKNEGRIDSEEKLTQKNEKVIRYWKRLFEHFLLMANIDCNYCEFQTN